MLRRCVDGRPASALPTDYLAWHGSRAVRAWRRAHTQHVQRDGTGVRIRACYLPVKSPWLNAIEPKWTPTTKRIVAPDRLLSSQELADRLRAALDCAHEPHLAMPKKVA